MTLTPEDFEAWRHAPLTEFILSRFLAAEMARTRAAHDAAAWQGPLDPAGHASHRERYETLEWLKDLTFEDIDEWLKETR